MDLNSYSLEELKSHFESAFSSNNEVLPLSPLRLHSYLSNPRAEPTDHVLFEIQHEGIVVAYRTLLPDLFYDAGGNPQRFAWLSGNYVLPEFRRQGFSTRLLQLVEAQWDGRLMYTNYAPDSKALYDRTGQFRTLARSPGKRFYLRSASNELLGNRLGSKELLNMGDRLVNQLREGKLQRFPAVESSLCKIESVTGFDQEVSQLINRTMKQSLFRRDIEIFSWIMDHPWVTDKEVDPVNYHFTYQAHIFKNLLFKFTLPENRGLGLLWLVIHNQKLSVPYLFLDNKEIYPLMARTIIHTMIGHGCAYTTIRNSGLVGSLILHKNLFLSIREMPQWYFSHRKMAGQVPDSMEIYDGDGDVVFTG